MDWNIPLWILQIVMAVAFFGAGYTHAFGYERARTNPRMVWMTAVSTAPFGPSDFSRSPAPSGSSCRR